MSDSVGIGDFEAAFLQVFAVIKHGAANEKRALRVDNEMHVLRRNKNVAFLRSIYQVHHILQTGTAATDDLEAQRARPACLFLQAEKLTCCAAFSVTLIRRSLPIL